MKTIQIGTQVEITSRGLWTDKGGETRTDSAVSLCRVVSVAGGFANWERVRILTADVNCPNQTAESLAGENGGFSIKHVGRNPLVKVVS